MEFNRIYNRQEFVNFLQNSFLPEDFMSSTTPVEFRTKMKYTTCLLYTSAVVWQMTLKANHL